jgi:hypothetical protein
MSYIKQISDTEVRQRNDLKLLTVIRSGKTSTADVQPKDTVDYTIRSI